MAKENQATVKNQKFKSKPKKPNKDKEPSSSASSNESKAPSDSGSSATSKSAASSSGSGAGAAASSAASSSASSSEHSWVLGEIQGMMHGFGDTLYPSLESAKLIEDIMTQQMKLLYHRAAEAATLRGAKAIGIEDVLFLMRKDKAKLGRLIRYLELKSLKGYLYSKLPTEDNEDISPVLLSAESDEKSQIMPQFKRAKICNDFVSFIDQTGELADVFSEAPDEVESERQVKMDNFTKTMDQAQYLAYCNARASSFCRKNKMGRFREWLLKDVDSDMKPAPSVLDVFSYLAYETVAEIVDLAMTVKKESRHDPCDPLSYCMPTLVGNPEYPSCRLFGIQENPWSNPEDATPSTSKAGSGGKEPFLPSDGIKPEDIKEAMRRFTMHRGPMASFSKSQIQGPCRKLLCC